MSGAAILSTRPETAEGRALDRTCMAARRGDAKEAYESCGYLRALSGDREEVIWPHWAAGAFFVVTALDLLA